LNLDIFYFILILSTIIFINLQQFQTAFFGFFIFSQTN
jgi:hypothetical protein